MGVEVVPIRVVVMRVMGVVGVLRVNVTAAAVVTHVVTHPAPCRSHPHALRGGLTTGCGAHFTWPLQNVVVVPGVVVWAAAATTAAPRSGQEAIVGRGLGGGGVV